MRLLGFIDLGIGVGSADRGMGKKPKLRSALSAVGHGEPPQPVEVHELLERLGVEVRAVVQSPEVSGVLSPMPEISPEERALFQPEP